MTTPDIKKIDALLPQTQCTRCGYDDCLSYAKAIAQGTPHNQCPPGGQQTINNLSHLLKRPNLTLNPNNGIEKAWDKATIIEADCIGCTKCIQACPVDAIIGTAKHMHTVIESECTGCELCVAPCPVDCIVLEPMPKVRQPEYLSATQYENQQDHFRTLYQNHKRREHKLTLQKQMKHTSAKNLGKSAQTLSSQDKQDFIAAAIARAASRKQDNHNEKN